MRVVINSWLLGDRRAEKHWSAIIEGAKARNVRCYVDGQGYYTFVGLLAEDRASRDLVNAVMRDADKAVGSPGIGHSIVD